MSISAKASISNPKYTPDPTRSEDLSRPEDLSIFKADPSLEIAKKAERLVLELMQCPLGKEGWRAFEKLCRKIISFALAPCFSPFGEIEEQSYSISGIDRLDYRIPNNTRNDRTSAFWQEVKQLYNTHNIVIECKNLTDFLPKEEILQTAGYSWHTNGRFRIIFSRKGVDEKGMTILRDYYRSPDNKLILVFSEEDLIELIRTRPNSIEPEDILCRLRTKLFKGI